jgi:hypothetical protein
MLPEMLKPAAIGEATFVCSRWAPRGDWRWRVRTEKSRNLRDPNNSYGIIWKSDIPIVAKKQGNSCGAKGDDYRYVTVEVYDASA